VGVPNGDRAFITTNDAIDRTILTTSSNATAPAPVFLLAETIGSGSLVLNAAQGRLDTTVMFLAPSGRARFVQSSGTVTASQDLELAANPAGAGTWELLDGHLSGASLSLGGGGGGQGFMFQSGGTVVFDSLTIGTASRYEMSGGTLMGGYTPGQPGTMRIESGGQFIQSAGFHLVENFDNDGGSYQWSGGSLQIRHNFTAGVFSFPSTAVSLNIDGIADFSHANVTNGANVSMTLTDTSLFIRSGTFDPTTVFGSFFNPGLTHIAGDTLIVAQGHTLHLDGTFYDSVECFGNITPPAGSSVYLDSLQTVGAGAYVDTGGGTVRASLQESRIQGGELHAGALVVRGPSSFQAVSNPVVLQQSGGSVTVNGVDVGGDQAGQYLLSGGVLATASSLIGDNNEVHGLISGPGTFAQSGGAHYVDGPVILGRNAGTGNYVISGGILTCQSLHISAPGGLRIGNPPTPPVYGTGEFDVTNSAASITISQQLFFGPDSTYNAVPGTTIHMIDGSRFDNVSTDEAALDGLGNTKFIFDFAGTDASPFEVGGKDFGPVLDGFTSNFAVDTIQLGDGASAGIELDDLIDNQPASGGAEALYVKHLIVGPGSSVFLNNLNLYCLDYVNNGGTVFGGNLTVVPEPDLSGVAIVALVLARRRRREKLAVDGTKRQGCRSSPLG
jgi:hypothetical protein